MNETTAAWPPAPAGKLAWAPATRERFATILAAILPPEEVGGDRSLLPEFAGAFAATLPVGRRLGIRAMADALWYVGPAALLRKPTTFGELSQDDQEALLRKVAYSKLYLLRLAGVGLKSLAGLGVLGDPAARVGIGVDPAFDPLPPLVERVRWLEDIEGLGRPEPAPQDRRTIPVTDISSGGSAGSDKEATR